MMTTQNKMTMMMVGDHVEFSDGCVSIIILKVYSQGATEITMAIFAATPKIAMTKWVH